MHEITLNKAFNLCLGWGWSSAGRVLVYLAGMLVMVSTDVTNTETKAAWEGKDLFQYTVLYPSPSSKEVREGTQAGRSLVAGRNLVAGNETEATGECCLLTHLACFLTVPGTQGQGWHCLW